MAKKLKYLFLAFGIFNEIIDNNPMMSGCYQWIRVHDGKVANFNMIDEKDFEKYDVIQINMDGMDLSLVPKLREILGEGTSTKIVLNQDYSPEEMKKAFMHPWDMIRSMNCADYIFATTPAAQAYLQSLTPLKIYMIPHPVETHALKKIGSMGKQDYCMIIYHRYNSDTFSSFVALQNLQIPYVLTGYVEKSDKRSRWTKASFPRIIPYVPFIEYLKLISEAKIAYAPFLSWTWGRSVADAAALGTPVVGSNTVLAQKVCFPDLAVDPYDMKATRHLLHTLYNNDGFREQVTEQAKYSVEYFGHKKSKERFMTMIEDKPQTMVV